MASGGSATAHADDDHVCRLADEVAKSVVSIRPSGAASACHAMHTRKFSGWGCERREGAEVSNTANTAVRGLATVAMLKTYFDLGRDHIAMFQPFVDDVLDSADVDGVTVAHVQLAVIEKHQLSLPPAVVKTLLSRAVKAGRLRREGGRYFDGNGADRVRGELEVARRAAETRQAEVADAFREHGSRRGVEIGSTEEALDAILEFLEKHHVRLALEGLQAQWGVAAAPTEHGLDDRLVASFLIEAIEAQGANAATIQEMLEGFVLQNALLLQDISTADKPFRNLRVFFDSTLLFAALGHHGDEERTLTGELLTLLRDRGASVEAFRPTIREMRGILGVYEEKLGTAAGRKSLRPTDLTRYFLTSRATPSDARAISALLEKSLEQIGIRVVDTPTRVLPLTLDEASLAHRLADRDGGDTSPRVQHDVDCVAGVLTLRGGNSSDSLDRAGAVFVSLSGLTVKNVNLWYRDEGGIGFPPIAHYYLISNLAWLKRPASASALKLRELMAMCSAALKPTRETWRAFVQHLEKLETSGQISTEEAAAILASSLTDRYLSEEELGDDPDATTLTEVVERVKAEYKRESEEKIEEIRREAESASGRVSAVEARVAQRAQQVGNYVAVSFFVALGVVFLLGVVVNVLSILAHGAVSPAFVVVAGLPLALGGLASVMWGFNLSVWKQNIQARVAGRLRSWMSDS